MQVLTQELTSSELFSWISEEGVEMFSNCFDLEVEQIPAGESRESRGRIGYLLSGATAAAGRHLAAGDTAGVTLEKDGTLRWGEIHPSGGGTLRDSLDERGDFYLGLLPGLLVSRAADPGDAPPALRPAGAGMSPTPAGPGTLRKVDVVV